MPGKTTENQNPRPSSAEVAPPRANVLHLGIAKTASHTISLIDFADSWGGAAWLQACSYGLSPDASFGGAIHPKPTNSNYCPFFILFHFIIFNTL
jgi:hypothetical protein